MKKKFSRPAHVVPHPCCGADNRDYGLDWKPFRNVGVIRHRWKLCCGYCLRKRMEANNPGLVRAISWRWSPEGPFSTLIIYEMLPPSRFIEKKGWRRRRRRDIKGMPCEPSRGAGETPQTTRAYGWAFRAMSVDA